MLEAIGTEDINQKYSIILYDFEQKRGVVTIDCKQRPTLLQQYAPEVLLVACEDYTYCYRIRSQNSTVSYEELFWTVSSKAFKIIPVPSSKPEKVCFILATHDLYLRYFVNEELLIE